MRVSDSPWTGPLIHRRVAPSRSWYLTCVFIFLWNIYKFVFRISVLLVFPSVRVDNHVQKNRSWNRNKLRNLPKCNSYAKQCKPLLDCRSPSSPVHRVPYWQAVWLCHTAGLISVSSYLTGKYEDYSFSATSREYSVISLDIKLNLNQVFQKRTVNTKDHYRDKP